MTVNYWKKENADGTINLDVQKGFEWGNDLLCRTLAAVNGHEFETEKGGKYTVTVEKFGDSIVYGTGTPIRFRVTVDFFTKNEVGQDKFSSCVFNEEYDLTAPLSDLTNALHDQRLEDLEFDIAENFPECYWGTYCPMDDAEHIRRGYTKITRREAEELAGLARYELKPAPQKNGFLT